MKSISWTTLENISKPFDEEDLPLINGLLDAGLKWPEIADKWESNIYDMHHYWYELMYGDKKGPEGP